MTVRRFLALWLVLPGLVLAQGEPPVERMELLEARLLQARQVRIEAHIEASGAVQAALDGFIELRDRNRARYSYRGTLAGKPVVVGYDAADSTVKLDSGGQSRQVPLPPESNRALLLGLMRMGLLHNIVRGTELQGPDHAGGGLAAWAALDNFRPMTFAQDGEFAGMPSLGFELLVNDVLSAGVQLWLDSDTGLPRRREQTVPLASGEMKVVETYTRFVLE